MLSGAPLFHPDGTRVIRSALFIDFDNIFGGLTNMSEPTAEQFATNPTPWLWWLSQQAVQEDPDYVKFYRRMVVRRCYMNPRGSVAGRAPEGSVPGVRNQQFHRYRSYFVSSGFETIDCPPLTGGGKSSADIQIVIDVLDLLHHGPPVDEFIMLSSDADFTPLLRRLRRYDHRTVVLADANASRTYQANCDLFLEMSDLDAVLEGKEEVDSFPTFSPQQPPLNGPTSGRDRGFLTPSSAGEGQSAAPAHEDVISSLEVLVGSSPQPVVAATAVEKLRQVFGAEVHQLWRNRKFRDFVEDMRHQLGKLPFETSWVIPGYLYDPERHEMPRGSASDWEARHPELATLAKEAHAVANIPFMPPETYRQAFQCIAETVNRDGFHFTDTSKSVRDCCNEKGAMIARNQVNFILHGLLRTHGRLEAGVEAQDLAKSFEQNVVELCGSEELDLSEEGLKLIGWWIRGEQQAQDSDV